MISWDIFRKPLTWLILLAAAVMSVLMTLGYLGAFLSPEDHTRHAPFVIVNEDTGASIGGQPVNLGEQVLDAIVATEDERVEWTVLDSRDAVLDTLHDDDAYAAIVIPEGYSAALAALMQPAAGDVPAPATIDVLANPAAGPYATTLARNVTTTAVDQVSAAVNAQLVQGLGGETAAVPVALGAVIAQPVVATTIDAQPTGPHTASGNGAFYYALLLMLAGFIGVDIIFLGMEMVSGRSTATCLVARVRGDAAPMTPREHWTTRVVLAAALAVVAGIANAAVAVGLLHMSVDRTGALVAFGMLAVFASAMFTLMLLTLLGTPGLLVAIIVQTFLGVPSAQGIYPAEMLPTFYQWIGNVLPLRHITDGVRAIMFYDANPAAGLATALAALVTMTVVALAVSGLAAWRQDARAGEAALTPALA